jgi:signal peptidase I
MLSAMIMSALILVTFVFQLWAVFCKRLVGMPGERLRFENGTIFINDQPADVPKVLQGRCRATIPNERNPRYTGGQTIVLGGNEYFLIGDNIDISGDSRYFGPTNRADLIGVVDLMYWPIDRLRIVR